MELSVRFCAIVAGVYLHVLADTLGSVGVIISSYFVTNYGWNIADPICSLFISGAIAYSAIPLVNDTLIVLALRAPAERNRASPERIVQKVRLCCSPICLIEVQVKVIGLKVVDYVCDKL